VAHCGSAIADAARGISGRDLTAREPWLRRTWRDLDAQTRDFTVLQMVTEVGTGTHLTRPSSSSSGAF
jgi:hypothetical protein